MTTIDLETHFYTTAAFDYLAKRKNFPLFVKEKEAGAFNLRFTEQVTLFQNQDFIDTLCDIGSKRVQLMDQAGLDIQVLSFSSPGVDELYPDHQAAAAINRHPTRFMGFAAISPYDVKQSVLPGFIKERPAIKKNPSEVIFENVYVTTSGRFSKTTLEFTLKIMGDDHVMLATDHPYEDLKQSIDFIRGCKLPDKTLQKICHGNAEKLGIKLKK